MYAAEEKRALVLLAELRAFLAERGILVRPLDVNIVEGKERVGTMAVVESCGIHFQQFKLSQYSAQA